MSVFFLKEYDQGCVIFEEGMPGYAAYILKKGSVEISTTVCEKKIVIATLKPLAVFGEMALLLKGNKRTATAIALEDSEVIEIDKKAFDQYVQKSPKIIRVLLTTFADRLRETTIAASRKPDIFLAICNILSLAAPQREADIIYEDTVGVIAKALLIDPSEIEEKLNMMENLGLIEIRDKAGKDKIIRLPEKEEFYERAVKLHGLLSASGAFEIRRD